MLQFYLLLIESQEDKIKIEKIYEKYLDWMLKLAYHYAQDINDAEDAVSDVFLNIISSKCSIPLDSENKTKCYLFICVRNSVSKIREAKSKNKTVDLDELFSLCASENIEDEIVQRDSCEFVLKYLDALSPIYKDVLTLYLYFGKTLTEIAQLLNIPFKTAETRLRRGKIILRERLGDIDI